MFNIYILLFVIFIIIIGFITLKYKTNKNYFTTELNNTRLSTIEDSGNINKDNLILELINTNYDYIYEKYNIKYISNDCYPSSYIFEIFTKNNYIDIYNKTVEIQNFFGINKTVYGIKKINNEYFFEYYYYYKNENILNNITNIFKFFNINMRDNFDNYYLVSFELNKNTPNNINEINIYYPVNNCGHNTPIYFHNIYICKKCIICMNKTFNIKSNTSENKNIYKFFLRKTSTNDEIFNYTKTLIGKNIDINIIFPPYLLSCEKSICVTKKPKAIGFYFSLIPFDDFIIFLEKTNFDNKLVTKLLYEKSKLSYLFFDVGFDIKVNDDNKIIFTKLSFYGIL